MFNKIYSKIRKFILPSFIVIAALAVGFYVLRFQRPNVETKFVQDTVRQVGQKLTGSDINIIEPGESALVENNYHEYQTFNNCGPTTLAMILNWHGANTTQKELGDLMRPYQVASGDNDDKTIFTYEFVDWARQYGFNAVARRNGDIKLLKTLTANGIPVVVKTWLNVDEDIGHFRLIRGFDEGDKVVIQDDSYHGPNKKIPYFDLLSMWQPFNYDYMIVYTDDLADKVETILAEEFDEDVAWQNALERAQNEAALDPGNPYPVFNISTAAYHLGDYQRSVEEFEKVQGNLPFRMLWYQIEAIQAYQELGNYERVFSISDNILENGNRAFSELYLIKGEIYLEQGNIEAAREQFEIALTYNENYQAAKEALNAL